MGVSASGGSDQNNQPQNISAEKTGETTAPNPAANTANAAGLNTILQSSEQVASLFSDQDASGVEAEDTGDTSADSTEASSYSDSDQPIDRDGGGSSGNGSGSRSSEPESYSTESYSATDDSSAQVTTTTSSEQSQATTADSTTSTTTTTTSTTNTDTDTGTTDPDAPTTETAGPAPLSYKEEKEDIPKITADTNAYVRSSITQKTQKEIGELSNSLRQLSNGAANNELGLSDRTASLSTYHFQTASNLVTKSGQEENAYVNLVAGYSAIFSEVLTTPGGLEAALGSTLTAQEAKYTADVFTKVLSGEYELPNAATLEAAQSIEQSEEGATGQQSVSSSTIANILGAFAADVTMNEVNLGEYSSTTSQLSADIGETSMDVAQGQLENLQDQIDKLERQQKKAKKWGKLTQGLTVAALAVGIVVMTAVAVGTAGGASPLAIVTIGIMVGALSATVADMAKGGDSNSMDAAMNAMAGVVQSAARAMGTNLSDNEAKLITGIALAVILGAATGGAGAYAGLGVGSAALTGTAIGLTTLSTVNFWGTASEELANEFNLSDKETMILTITLTVAAAILTLGFGVAAGSGSVAGTTDDFAQTGAQGSQAAGKGAQTTQITDDTTQMAQNTNKAQQAALKSSDDLDSGIEMTNLKASNNAGAAGGSSDDGSNVVQESAETGANATQGTQETKSALETADETSRASTKSFEISQKTADNLADISSALNIASGGAQAAQGIMQGKILQERAKLALEQADVDAVTTIMRHVNQTQLALSSTVLQNYSSAVEGLGASTSAFLQQSAAGAQELAKVLGDAA